VEVDLTGVEFMDSTGLMAMSRLRVIAMQRGGRVRLLRPARPVRRILDVSGFGALCEIVTD
jgi:anti-anti-sigma factor